MDDKREIPVVDIEPRADQPRTDFDPASLLDLGNNMLALGQILPILVFWLQSAKRYVLVDGERRWRAAKLVGIKNLIAIVLEHEPTPSELHQIQMCIEAHRVGLSAMEKSDFLFKMKQENSWSITELAEKLTMKQPLVTKLLKFQDGCSELREALRTGSVDQDKAYTICLEPDHVKQRELLKESSSLTREQLRQKARSDGEPADVKAAVARFPLSCGVMVSVQGRKMNLTGAIDAMLEAVKELKKGQAEHWDITTAMRVMRDKAKSTK
jgi:ParB/RepB/Spo0J family partition protein